ncbi:Pro-kumamolisin, activation domain [Teratosphaeria destructans]|uniref:tripeptidyl-peptidase II n=1 Tax=Teratosphaeria destructans TaxID=418781 RepID=A0A9W7SZH0_9PEZI|nr:Pro-kumamolisin, activation domain [Teratosphaeria destructans]
MHFSRLLTAVGFIAATAASPISASHSVHERRSTTSPGWTKRDASDLDRRALLPMRIGLKQRNLDRAWDWLREVSSPDYPTYGQHWTPEQVADAFAPSEETIDSVRAWLISSGIAEERIQRSEGRNWLRFEASVDEAEDLLKTKYHIFEHHTGKPHVACDEYSIPAHLQEHIDIILPTVHFDAKVLPGRGDHGLIKREKLPGVEKGLGEPGSGSLPKVEWHAPQYNLSNHLSTCDSYITPDCLRALYGFPINTKAVSGNSYGIVEYTPQSYVPSDLDMFFKNFSRQSIGERPKLDSIDGGYPQQTDMSFDYNGESNLDLEYSMTLVYPQKVTLYQVGDLVEGASFNNFLDAIDGSYCTYKGGDDPTQDGVYPDPYTNYTGAYEGKENCGGFAATKVISTSYGYNEHDLTPFYEQRQCNEYMKLGLLGVSVLYSSGDYGVAGNSGECIDGPGQNASYTNGTTGRFNPSFPGTCPYITSVGATQAIPGTNIESDLATGTQPEEASETVIYSGGGFSNVFALPDYQKTAVRDWFKDYPPPYGADRFNNSQNTRGLPDISANGANYVVAIDGEWALVYGTSASSPTLGSILTLINEARLEAGKSTIGFINPVAYANPSVFNDVTQGGNEGCGTAGFSASPGWDPVTGLGTPNYPKMLDLWLSLS